MATVPDSQTPLPVMGTPTNRQEMNGYPAPRAVTTLCKDCVEVRIAPDSFVINKGEVLNTVSQSKHIALHRPRGRARQGDSAALLKSGTQDIPLPDFKTIATRAKTGECSLCNLVWQAVTRYSPKDDVHSCSIRWEVDGHEEVAYSNFVNRTRRLRLMWNTSHTLQLREAFLVIVARSSAQTPNSDAVSFGRHGKIFQGKSIEREKGKQALIKSWIDLCCKHHHGTCDVKVTQDDAFKSMLRETYFGVIDVTDLQLKPLPLDNHGRPCKYVALSYVWYGEATIYAMLQVVLTDHPQGQTWQAIRDNSSQRPVATTAWRSGN